MYTKTTVLNTREPARGDRQIGQIIPIPSSVVGKVSLYLERELIDSSLGSLVITVNVYGLDISGLPTGSPIATDTKLLSDINYRGLINFNVQSSCPSSIAVVLSFSGGDADNYIAWRYVSSSTSSTESLLISEDGGLTWTKDPNRKFAYIAYSPIDSAVTFDSSLHTASFSSVTSSDSDQTALIQAGKQVNVTDSTNADFNQLTLDRAVVDGDSIVISFGDFVVTLVVDQSGSMTWNDRKGVRFDFLKAYIDDMEDILPSSSQALYSVLKFNSRKLGRMRVILQSNTSLNAIAGTRIIRKVGMVPVLNPSDGIVIFEGLGEQVLDGNLIEGTTYQYGAFTFDDSGNFSDSRLGDATPASTINEPMGIGAFLVQEVVVKNGDYDIGKRNIKISWIHPSTTDSDLAYDQIYLIRRTDRFALTPTDGTLLASFNVGDSGYDGPYIDFDTPGFDQHFYPAAGLTYYYTMFTENANGIRCILQNARTSSVMVSEVDRFWEKAQPPFNDPTIYGFYATPLPNPVSNITAVIGDGVLSLSWDAGLNATRYVVYYSPDSYPTLIGLNAGDTTGYDGTAIYDGDQTSFIHRGLENGQPHFYVIVAYDNVANQSAGVQFFSRPVAQANTIPPPPVNSFTAEPYNSTTNLITWKLPISDSNTISGWFGDSISAKCDVTFEDSDPRTTISTLEFIEETRTTVTLNTDGSTTTLTNNNGKTQPLTGTDATLAATAVDPQLGIQFSNVPQDQSTSITSVFSASPLLSVQSRMDSVSMQMHALLSAKNKTTGELIVGVKTDQVAMTLKNPLGINIVNEPEKTIHRPVWDPTCDQSTSPELDFQELPGVYVKTGDSFNIHIDVLFKDQPLDASTTISFRILDSITGQPSTTLVLPTANAAGVTLIQTITDVDEVLDRTGQPTGETKNVTRAFIELPPQDIPGDYILEATALVSGFTKIVTYKVHYEASLNIDVDAHAFNADGITIAEQSAYVYFGDPTGSNKFAVPDQTVVDWKITPLDFVSVKNVKKRPFFSRDSVPGTGIKSYTVSGTAKNVFFGPGTDIGPETVADQTKQEATSCSPGNEVYELSASVKVGGMTRTGFGLITLQGAEGDTQLNRIFLRKVDGFNTDIIYADGIVESAWEVLALPETDGTIEDIRSGAFFHDAVTSAGGLVPQLPNGKIITLVARQFAGSSFESIFIRTDLTGSEGRPNYAKATVINGKATFYLRLNTRVSGKIKQRPLPGEANASSNIIYGSADNIVWDESALIYSLTVYTSIEVNGAPIVFYGGGSNLEFHTPPAFLAFNEPLSLGIDQDQQETE